MHNSRVVMHTSKPFFTMCGLVPTRPKWCQLSGRMCEDTLQREVRANLLAGIASACKTAPCSPVLHASKLVLPASAEVPDNEYVQEATVWSRKQTRAPWCCISCRAMHQGPSTAWRACARISCTDIAATAERKAISRQTTGTYCFQAQHLAINNKVILLLALVTSAACCHEMQLQRAGTTRTALCCGFYPLKLALLHARQWNTPVAWHIQQYDLPLQLHSLQ